MTTAMMRSGAALGVLVLLGLASAAALPVHAGTPALTTPSVTAPSVTAPSPPWEESENPLSFVSADTGKLPRPRA